MCRPRRTPSAALVTAYAVAVARAGHRRFLLSTLQHARLALHPDATRIVRGAHAQRAGRAGRVRLARAGHRHRAGKTVLAIQLVLDLAAAALIVADSEEPDIAGRGATGRRPLLVPVRLSPPAFDSMPGEEDRNGVAAEVGSARLDAWLVGHLVSVYGVPEKQAAALVAEGWILPVLDGLDEMDPDDQALPRRAASLIRALNCPTLGGLRPVVVTCRTGRYRELSTIRDVPGGPADGSGGLPGGAGSVAAEPAGAVQDATAVEVEPLTVPA